MSRIIHSTKCAGTGNSETRQTGSGSRLFTEKHTLDIFH